MRNERNEAIRLLDLARERGVSDESMIEYIIYNCMSDSDAQETMESILEENGIEE